MNMRSKILTGLACLALVGTPVTGQDRSSSLTAIRYEQRPGGSRLTLQFAGEIRYALSRSADRLVLRFPGTTLANRTGAGTLRFLDGQVRSVSTGRVGADSLMVAVVLRERAVPTLLRPPAGNVLYLDVAGDPGVPAAQMIRTAVAVPVRAAVPQSTKRTIAGSPVDIPALARSQSEVQRQAAERHEQAVARPAPAQSPEASAGEGILRLSEVTVAGTAVLLSVCTTITLLLFLRRRTLRRAGPEPATEADQEAPIRTETVYRMPELTTMHPQLDDTIGNDAEPMFDDQVQMARAFQRGKGEVGLAMALRARTPSKASRQRLVDVAEKRGSHAQRRTAARKLGVGVGEVELAMQLQKLQNRTKQKEGTR